LVKARIAFDAADVDVEFVVSHWSLNGQLHCLGSFSSLSTIFLNFKGFGAKSTNSEQ
jgi:hypothetical protein